MVNKIKKILKRLSIPRTTVLGLLFLGLACVLIHRLFQLQIIEGEDYVNDFNMRTTKTRTLKSTRGNIYDRNGEVLASNELAYSITLEDNGTYDSDRVRNLTLNKTAYQVLKILTQNGDSVDVSFHIVLDEDGNYVFDVDEGVTLDRFRADIYGEALIDDMTKEQANSTAEEIMDYLTGDERFCLVLTGDNAYTEEELDSYDLPAEYTPQELLDMTKIRYALSTNSFQKYMPVTIATQVSNESIAAVMENQEDLQGVEVVEDSIRSYDGGIYFSSIIGYTGQASSEELEELRKERKDYSSDAVVGKAGIEQYMETQLQGTDGEETVYVDNLGKVLQIDEDSRVEPTAGNDVYLTIDKDMQESIYHILEQRVAGILLSKIVPSKTFDVTAVSDASEIQIPIYDVYNALIANSVIDINDFDDEDASETEKNLYAKFQQKQQEIFDRITQELTGDSPKAFRDLDEQMQEYISYIADTLLTSKLEILLSNSIDRNDATYQAWEEDHSISLQDYLTYAASQNWIDISKISPEGEYLDSTEVYQALAAYITDYLETDTDFSKLLYKYMLQEDKISGTELCTVLYEQGVLSKDDGMYESLVSGATSSYDFMITKISNLEITPGQLALDPCSASCVVTDVNTGEVLACVTYPGYDNNRLANQMDQEYYAKLNTDLTSPLFNKATQQRTAPGSTFKLVSAIVGMKENLIDDDTIIDCTGVFDLVQPPINCWNKSGHGGLDLTSAIEQSCNVFFNTIGFMAGEDEEGNFSETRSLQTLHNYASMLDLDKTTGIEITESAPQVSDQYAVPSYMGQGTHLYTTSQLARYVTTLANEGTSFQLSLLDKLTDSTGELIEDYTPGIQSELDLPSNLWDDIHNGMQRVIQTHPEFAGLGMSVAGKTGTAQESTTRPDHGLFIGYAPADEPEVAIAIRIPNGYSSGNACLAANDVFKYIFDLTDEKNIVTGIASSDTSNSSTD